MPTTTMHALMVDLVLCAAAGEKLVADFLDGLSRGKLKRMDRLCARLTEWVGHMATVRTRYLAAEANLAQATHVLVITAEEKQALVNLVGYFESAPDPIEDSTRPTLELCKRALLRSDRLSESIEPLDPIVGGEGGE